MSDYNFENYSNGEFDDAEDLAWNEADWLRYLHQTRREIEQFIHLYRESKLSINRLDEVANAMGWEKDEWNFGDKQKGEDESFAIYEIISEEDDIDFEGEPYTFHKSPVYIVSVGLYTYVKRCLEKLLAQKPGSVSPILAWNLAKSLNEGEQHAVQAVASIDMGDHLLAISHLKYSLRALNESFSLLTEIDDKKEDFLELFSKGIRIGLFDLREVWLRTMQECREGMDSFDSFNGGDFE